VGTVIDCFKAFSNDDDDDDDDISTFYVSPLQALLYMMPKLNDIKYIKIVYPTKMRLSDKLDYITIQNFT
jgi:hypothetical protein